MLTWGIRGWMLSLRIQGYNSITNGGNFFKLICGHMFIKFLICRNFLHKTYESIWLEQLVYFYTKRGLVSIYGQNAHPLGQNAHSWVSCLTQWSNLSIIIKYNCSNSIKIRQQLSVVCVISIISYRYITFFKNTLRVWDPIITNMHCLWANIH